MASSNTIITNKGAIYIGSQLSVGRKKVMTAQSQLASGLKNPDPATDPSAATLAMRQDGNITVALVVSDIVEQAEAIMQLGVGVLQSNATILNRLKDLSVRSTSATIDDTSRIQLDAEFQQLLMQMDLNTTTRWGTLELFTGNYQNMKFQIGINSGETMEVSFPDLSNATLGIAGLNIQNAAEALVGLDLIELAVTQVLNSLATVASYRSRLTTAGENMTVLASNLRSVVAQPIGMWMWRWP